MTGATSSSRLCVFRGRAVRKLLLATSALVPLGLSPPALANPLGGQVVGGSAAIAGTGTSTVTVDAVEPERRHQLAVVQHRRRRDHPVRPAEFVGDDAQPRHRRCQSVARSSARLQANGRVFVINPNGVLIGAGAVINTAGFLATTHDISNADFMAGRYNFNIPGNPTASVVNLGSHHRDQFRLRRRWSRPASATPAPSPRPSARSGSPPPTASRSISTATS